MEVIEFLKWVFGGAVCGILLLVLVYLISWMWCAGRDAYIENRNKKK